MAYAAFAFLWDTRNHEYGEVRDRRDQLTHPTYAQPELLAKQPNELWSWDIERHEALCNRAVMKGHRLRSVAADW
jgi:hypothetical protein